MRRNREEGGAEICWVLPPPQKQTTSRKQAVFLITVVIGHYRKLDGRRTAFRLEASIAALKGAIHVTEVCRNRYRQAAFDQIDPKG